MSGPSSPPKTIEAFLAIPGLRHGFLAGGGPLGGEPHAVARQRVAEALGLPGRLLFLTQVHGWAVQRAPWDGHPEGDGGVAEDSGLFLGIESADCLPVLFVDPARRAVAAAHAGWRGTVAGVARRALEALLAGGSDPRRVLAALGPAIGPCCYEVGEDVRAAFGPAGAPFFRPGPRGRPHLDLRAANLSQLESAGLTPAHVHQLAHCTFCHPEGYPSYRRQGPGGGRMTSYVGWAG